MGSSERSFAKPILCARAFSRFFVPKDRWATTAPFAALLAGAGRCNQKCKCRLAVPVARRRRVVTMAKKVERLGGQNEHNANVVVVRNWLSLRPTTRPPPALRQPGSHLLRTEFWVLAFFFFCSSCSVCLLAPNGRPFFWSLALLLQAKYMLFEANKITE